MAAAVTILRVCALAVVVRHALGCASPLPAPRAGDRAPTLEVPPLAPSAGSGDRTPSDGVVFGHPPATVGTAWTVAVTAVSQTPDPGGGIQLSTYDADYRVEVLAVEGPAPSRVRLRFDRSVDTYQEKETPRPIHGKQYIVDAKPPHVRDASDAAASPDETERVLDVFPDLGTRARIDEVMPDDAMRIGDRHDELAAAILRVLHPRAWTLREGSAALARIEAGHGVFTVKIDASSKTGLHLVVTGEARVRVRDARLTELALDGTYQEPKATPDAQPGVFRLRRTMRDAR